MSYASLLADTPQSEPLNARQVENNAGGYVFAVDDWTRLDRFLVLGSDAATYYQSAKALTRESAKAVLACYAADPVRTVGRIVELSETGRAPKNDPAVFALALGAAHESEAVRKAALAALPRVCRIGTHLFQFVDNVRGLGRGWGRSLKRAVANWYESKPVDAVAFQAIKYRTREGYTHKRLLQTAHPSKGDADAGRTALYRWICDKAPAEGAAADALPAIVRAHVEAMSKEKAAELLPLIRDHKLPWEALPTWANADPSVWKAMLPHLGLTALLRNLGNMTRIGAISPLSDTEAGAVAHLGDETAMRKARVHPFAVLQAMAVYGSGQGLRGAGKWSPSRPVLDALDRAFYAAFANVVSTGKRHLLALDVSGSMTSPLMGSALSARDGSAALALVTMATEPATNVVGFTSKGGGSYWGSRGAELTPLAISPRQRLTDAVRAVSGLPFGGTDCALPMLYALEKGLLVDVFVVYTDSETWAGNVHPVEALRRYRKATGIPAKLVVVGMTSSGFSIANPQDGGMLDVVGFDASAPAAIADFIRG
jgi:60 kDa SS-A/Ro ribonucleoprotein